MSAPRKRFQGSKKDRAKSAFDSTSEVSKTLNDAGLTEKFWLAVISSCILLFVIVDVNYHTFPQPNLPAATTTTTAAGQSPTFTKLGEQGIDGGNFSELNARDFLEVVCKLGTRHLGSHANEVLAVDAIVERVEAIQKLANPVHLIEMDIQIPSGCFDLHFVGGFTSCYTNVKNVLVQISPATRTVDAALLVNCHYDTAISSPGGYTAFKVIIMLRTPTRVLVFTHSDLRVTR